MHDLRLTFRTGARASAVAAALAVFQTVGCGVAMAADCGKSPAAGVDWTDCRKRNLMLDGTDLSASKLDGADLSSTDLRDTKLGGTSFEKASLGRAMLDGADGPNSDFSKALGYRTSFVKANLAGANFTKSEMQRADFTDANLNGADFEKTELGRVIFTGADINGTKFSFSNLARADFRGSIFDTPIDFTSAYFYRTRFDGVDLSAAQGLQQWQIDLACGDDNTKLPAGINPGPDWPCGEE